MHVDLTIKIRISNDKTDVLEYISECVEIDLGNSSIIARQIMDDSE